GGGGRPRVCDDTGLHQTALHRKARQSDAGRMRLLDGLRHLRDEENDQLQVLRHAAMDINNLGIFNILFDRDFIVISVVGVLAFATIVTFVLRLLDKQSLGTRMKAVSEKREELRAKHHAALNKRGGSLRTEPITFMKQTVERLKLSNILESPNTRDKLTQAGF